MFKHFQYQTNYNNKIIIDNYYYNIKHILAGLFDQFYGYTNSFIQENQDQQDN